MANKHQVINLQQYLPADYTPKFFQPPSGVYVIDIAIGGCLKATSNDNCGIPSSQHGNLGNIDPHGGWNRIDKDLSLKSSWFKRQFFSYKTISSEGLQAIVDDPSVKTKADKRVIIDIAVVNPEVDYKIKNNRKFPKYILEQFNDGKVFTDDDHHDLIELSKQAGGKPKFDMAENLKKLKEHEEEKEKLQEEELNAQNLAEEEAKQANKQEKLEQAEQEKQIKHDQDLKDKEKEKVVNPDLEEVDDKDEQKDEQKDDGKGDEEKNDQKNDAPNNENEDEKNEDKDNEKAQDNSDPEKDTPQRLKKRKTETSRHSLDRLLYIPTKEQMDASGWVYKSNGIWVRYGHNTNEAITAIDILFGEDCVEPRPNWNLINSAPIQGISTPSDKPAFITFRRGAKINYQSGQYQKKLKFGTDGKFKILQVADLHFSTGVGKCRDPSPQSTKNGCEADPRTLKFLDKVLDYENPDFVVLTGDQIFGENAPDSASAVFKALYPFIKRQIPFAVTLGNHDDEGSLTREEVMSLSANLPFSLSGGGPDEVEGVGNYMLNVESKNGKPGMVMYFLDTHKYSLNPKAHPGYDWIKESQLRFLEREHGSVQETITDYSSKFLSMAFFHIPLPEYRNLDQPRVGDQREGVTSPRYNSGARKVLGQMNVKVVSVGHDHCNEYCLRDLIPGGNEEVDNIWLCYGGGSGEGGYGGYGGYTRKLRLYEVDVNEGRISTWKRKEDSPDAPFDYQDLVRDGVVI